MSGTYTSADRLFPRRRLSAIAALVIVVWLFGAAIGVFLMAPAVRLGAQPVIDELRATRIVLEDLHDQYSVDADMKPVDG